MLAVPTPRILVADDNPLSLRFFAEALAALDFDSAEAVDGTEALERAGECVFDLLLLDARMPKLGGVDVLAGIRANPGPSQHAIALATTADNGAQTRASLLDAGFSDVLVKPLSIETLRNALARHLPAAAAPVDDALDDAQALAAAGGDAAIVAALRGLLAGEIDGLPAEFAAINAQRDANALRERLHRLDASAGFCGMPALLRAASALRVALDGPTWPQAAIAEFLETCVRLRVLLAR